jgi:hypothetical protein
MEIYRFEELKVFAENSFCVLDVSLKLDVSEKYMHGEDSALVSQAEARDSRKRETIRGGFMTPLAVEGKGSHIRNRIWS